jgi:hypothetical protein
MWVRLSSNTFPAGKALLVDNSLFDIAEALHGAVKDMVARHDDYNRLVYLRLPDSLLKAIRTCIRDGAEISTTFEGLFEECLDSIGTQDYFEDIRVETLRPAEIPLEISNLISYVRIAKQFVIPIEEHDKVQRLIEAAEDYFRN